MQRIRQIFWDNDGILVDTEHLYFQSTREVLAGVGVELSEDLYRELLLHQARGAWFLAAERGCSEEQLAALQQERNRRYAELIVQTDVRIAGAEETVAALHGRLAMGVVTSSRGEHFELIHREGRITRYMDFVLWKGMYARSKPDPAPYLEALQRSDASPEECLVIEDSRRGLEAAAAAGLRCWVIPTDLSRNQDFTQAERILGSIAEVEIHLKPFIE